MKHDPEKTRVWWEELAEQYRLWAHSPPRDIDGMEQYTCIALHTKGDWWGFGSALPQDCLIRLWQFQYGLTALPAGFRQTMRRPQLRKEFCTWMADTIEEWLETGKGPWETE